MPIYTYLCGACGQRSEQFQKMSSLPATHCDACGGEALNRIPSLTHTDLKEFHTPIDMHSIAMEDPDEIQRFLKDCPDVECSLDPENPMYGVPIARNRSQKRKALAAAGFAERN